MRSHTLDDRITDLLGWEIEEYIEDATDHDDRRMLSDDQIEACVLFALRVVPYLIHDAPEEIRDASGQAYGPELVEAWITHDVIHRLVRFVCSTNAMLK